MMEKCDAEEIGEKIKSLWTHRKRREDPAGGITNAKAADLLQFLLGLNVTLEQAQKIVQITYREKTDYEAPMGLIYRRLQHRHDRNVEIEQHERSRLTPEQIRDRIIDHIANQWIKLAPSVADAMIQYNDRHNWRYERDNKLSRDDIVPAAIARATGDPLGKCQRAWREIKETIRARDDEEWKLRQHEAAKRRRDALAAISRRENTINAADRIDEIKQLAAAEARAPRASSMADAIAQSQTGDTR